jgi:hypothetical protein
MIIGCSIRYVERSSPAAKFINLDSLGQKEPFIFHFEPNPDGFETTSFNWTREIDFEFSKPLLSPSFWHELLDHQRFQLNKTMWFQRFSNAQLEELRESAKVISNFSKAHALTSYDIIIYFFLFLY